jgi:hypothetical protein
VRVYPENVMFEWSPVIGPDSGGVSWAHPWQSRMTIIAHAARIRRHILTLMNSLSLTQNLNVDFAFWKISKRSLR